MVNIGFFACRLLYQYAKNLKCGDQFRVNLSDEKLPTWFELRRREKLRKEQQRDEAKADESPPKDNKTN